MLLVPAVRGPVLVRLSRRTRCWGSEESGRRCPSPPCVLRVGVGVGGLGLQQDPGPGLVAGICEGVGPGVGLLFEIWIVDASILQLPLPVVGRCLSLGGGGCLLCLFCLFCGMPWLIVPGCAGSLWRVMRVCECASPAWSQPLLLPGLPGLLSGVLSGWCRWCWGGVGGVCDKL